MAYEDILKKYGVGSSNPTVDTTIPTPKTGYDSILAKYTEPQGAAVPGSPERISQIQRETQRDIALSEQTPGVGKMIKETIKGLPSALGQVFTAPFREPIKTAESVIGGALDLGPTIANSLASLVGIKGRLPKTGEMLNDYLGNTSDVQKAISQSVTTTAGYELGMRGTGLVPKVGTLPSLIKNPIGFVVGGQLISEAQTPKERAQQAAFDAVFGLGTELGIKAIGKGIGAIKGKPVTPEATVPVTPTASAEPKIIYKEKLNLGVDPKGEKILARTQVDAKTGNAIVFYDKSLNSNPELKGRILDHEFGHIVDKRINAGTNLSAELPNFAGNAENLNNVLGDFAKSKNSDVQTISGELTQDIKTLSGGTESANENFANAIMEYRKNPDGARKIAPTFVDFLEFSPVTKSIPRLTENITTKTTLAKPVKAPKIAQISPKIAPEKITGVDLLNEYKARGERISYDIEQIAESSDFIKTKVNPETIKSNLTEARIMTGSKQDIADYKRIVQGLKEGKKLPPVVLDKAGEPLDGYKRVVAAKKLGLPVEVYKPTSSKISPELQPLAQEARKYKSVEEFVKAQELLYHGTSKQSAGAIKKAGGFTPETTKGLKDLTGLVDVSPNQPVSLTLDEATGKLYAGARPEGGTGELLSFSSKNLKIADELTANKLNNDINKLRKAGYDGYHTSSPHDELVETIIFNKEKLKLTTKSQLTDFYNKAVGGVKEITKEVPKVVTKPGLISGTGLKTGKFVEGRPSFNPKSINAPTEVEQAFKDMGASTGEFRTQRISKGNEAILDLARITGLTEDQLIKAKPGSIANAETVTAARQLVLDKAQNLLNDLKSIDISIATPEQLKAFKDNFVTLVSMQKSVAGLRTEASNVFRSFGIELAPGENATLKELVDTLKQTEGFKNSDLSVFSKDVAKQMELTIKQKIGEAALSTWYAAILSGPKTTVRNLLSTTSNILTELSAKITNPMTWHEIPTIVSGLIKGLKEGLGEAKAVLGGAEATTKFFETGGKVRPEVFTGKWRTYGTVVESVGRWLNAQDRFLAAGAREMEKASIKLKNPELTDAVSSSIAKAYAESTVYHGLPKGRIGLALRGGVQQLRRVLPESKVIIPFVDTVANVLDRQFDYIPVFSAIRLSKGNLLRQVEQISKDFNITSQADKDILFQRLRDQQIGRLWLGTLISGGAIALAAQGRVSGNGPTNIAEKQQLERSGWRPNSIKLGDAWIPYTYLGPLGGIFSMVGNIYDKTYYDQSPNKTVFDLLGKGLVGWTQTQLDMSFLSGVTSVFDLINGNVDPGKWIKRFTTGLVPIPALYSQTKDMFFRQTYETQSIIEELRKKLGLTGNVFGLTPLQPKLDAFGEPIYSDLIYGITPSKETKDKVDNYLISNDLIVSKPYKSQQYTIPGTKNKRELTPEEYTKYLQESGREIYRELNNRLGYLSQFPQEKQKSEVEKLTRDIRERIRRQIIH